MEFGGRNFVYWNAELERAGGLLDLATEVSGSAHELRRGQFCEIAGGELGFDTAQLFTHSIDMFRCRGEPLCAHRFELDSVKVLDLELVLAAPVDEGGFGDVEFGLQARIGPTAGAEFDKTTDGLWCVHSCNLSRPDGRTERPQ